MNVLFIVHATAWSDKTSAARGPIQRLIAQGQFDHIIEVIQSRPDILAARYLQHDGSVFTHDEITPVPFFRERLFGPTPVFPVADAITLVGGVFNATGGGCLNVAFDHLIRYQQLLGQPTTITVPMAATYRERAQPWPTGRPEIEQFIKDLAWKLLKAKMPFELRIDDEESSCSGQDASIMLVIETPQAR